MSSAVPVAFPRSEAYNEDWVRAGVSGGANPLWLTEWLAEAMDLKRGMRVLDLGCGRALSSVFLHREFGVDVWAADLWFSPTENLQRILDAGAGDHVFPLRLDARRLPFADAFFDAIIAIDSYVYFGTDDLFLPDLLRIVRPSGQLGIAGAGLRREIDRPVPTSLKDWWSPEMACLHSAAWWRNHWERAGLVTVERADDLPGGWKLWRRWIEFIAPDNHFELQALDADQGEYLGYVRAVCRRNPDAVLPEQISTITTGYVAQPLIRPSRA